MHDVWRLALYQKIHIFDFHISKLAKNKDWNLGLLRSVEFCHQHSIESFFSPGTLWMQNNALISWFKFFSHLWFRKYSYHSGALTKSKWFMNNWSLFLQDLKKKKKATNKKKTHLYSSINNFDQKKKIKKEMEKENPVYLGYIWKTPQFSLNLITKLALTSIIFAGFLVHYFWKSWHHIADMHKRYKITLYFYTFCFIVLFALNQSGFFFQTYCIAWLFLPISGATQMPLWKALWSFLLSFFCLS